MKSNGHLVSSALHLCVNLKVLRNGHYRHGITDITCFDNVIES